MTRKPETKYFLGRTLEKQHESWCNTPVAFPLVTIGHNLAGTFVIVSPSLRGVSLQTQAKTERAARDAMVRELRQLRDELSKLEF